MKIHLVGIEGAGTVRDRPAAPRPRPRGQWQRRGRLSDPQRPARPRRDRPRRTRSHAISTTSTDGDTLVVSAAVERTTPSTWRPWRAGCACCPRGGDGGPDEGRRVVAVAGTHGKTTTTSLLTVALQEAGADPTYTIGGDLAATGVNAGEGSSDLFVAEADESDGAFLALRAPCRGRDQRRGRPSRPLGDRGGLYGRLRSSRTSRPTGSWCAGRRPRGGGARRRQDEAGRRVVPVSTRRARGRWTGSTCGRLVITIWPTPWRRTPGARTRACDRTSCAGARRLHRDRASDGPRARGRGPGLRHVRPPHVEIAGDLQAARSVVGDGRLVVAFQPHLVSRTRIFGAQMGRRWARPTRSWSSTSISPARTPTRPSPAPGRRCRAPADRERVFEADFDAVPAERCGAPDRGTSSSPSAPAASPRSARGARAARVR